MFSKLTSLRVTADGPGEPCGHVGRIDGLRGFAAWSVMVVHGFGNDGQDYYSPISASSEMVRHLHMSRAAVLLFFITSGYVIGLTNQGLCDRGRIVAYLRKRALRLIPLYLIALLLGWAAYRNVPPGTILANIFFLQNAALGRPALPGNLPLWSLHYEVVYYLGFILVWAFRPRLLPLVGVMLACTIGDWFFGGPLSFLGGWSAGGLYWLSGLLLAWYRPAAGNIPLLAYLLATYATNHLWPGVVLLKGLGYPHVGPSDVWLADLALLPGALVIFCSVARLDFRGLAVAKWLAFLIPGGTCALLLMMGRMWSSVPWTMAACALVIAIPLLLFEREAWSTALLKVFQPLGKISYGLYLLHVPLVAFTIWLYPWNGGPLNQLGGVLTWIGLTVAAAWLCETKLQPAVVNWFKVPVGPSPANPDFASRR